MNPSDCARYLEKAITGLEANQVHLAAHAESNAALHMASTVHYSPLYAHNEALLDDLRGAVKRMNGTGPGLAQPVHGMLDVDPPHPECVAMDGECTCAGEVT